ncbi:MAG TPA: ABC transporter ATP-binding protein [Candidatus Paenibacillus intestinavium]|nr:ABC transporter ATP-binding protein [Candidatus Paenibacillus intestinavium]
MDNILELQQISVKFGGLVALNGVDLTVRRGEILSVIGPNGAGKTTLFNIMTGIYQPSSGKVLYEEQPIHKLKPYKRVRLGIARTFQNTRLLQHLTVLENVLVAHGGCNTEGVFASIFAGKSAQQKRNQIVDECIEKLEIVGLASKVDQLAGSLPYGEQRLLEIARALATNCKLLLLDEPAAGMNQTEKRELMQKIKQLSKEYHIEIVLIEHDIGMIMEISDRIVVLNYGEKIAEGMPKEIQSNPQVISAYLGGEME